MCGLAGWVDYTRKLDDEFPAIFAMTDTLALRGPDAEGIWKHRNALLGHRRLAVIDLSGGVQPMSYRFPTGQEVTLVYTGECTTTMPCASGCAGPDMSSAPAAIPRWSCTPICNGASVVAST